MFNSPTIKDKKYYTLRDRNKMGERLESASEHVLASASKNKEEPRPLSLQSCNACTTKKELKRTPSPQQSMASRCTTSSQARRAQLELEAAKAKAKIQLDLIDKQLQVDIAMINDGDGSTQSRCSDFDPARTQEAVQDWMSKSMQPLDCPDPAAATTTAPEPALAAKVSESSRAPDPGPPVDSIVYLAETLKQIMTATPSQQDNRLLTRLSTPRELPTFDGDCIEWLHFKNAFKESTKICNYSDAENIWRLRRALKGQAKEAVTDLLIGNSPPNSVMEALELRFGRSDIVVQHLTMQIRKLPSLPLNYQQDLINFAIKVNNCVAALRAIDQYDYLSSPELLSSLTSKLPSPLLSRWMDYAFKNRDLNESKLQLLASFLKTETDKMAVVGIIQPCEQKKAEPFLHTKKTAFYKSRHNDNKHTVFATTSFNVDQKCTYCKKSAHLLPDCRMFKRAMRKDRWRYAKSNGLCFCCLLDRHDNNICPAPVCDINNCGRAHHKLLHFNRLTPPSTIRASTCDSDHDEPAAPAAAKESSTVAHVHTAPVFSEVHGTQGHSSITVLDASHVAVKVVKVQLYGPRVVYCDYSGSGRALHWIEEFMSRDVLPIHATRCTALSHTSGQSEIYRSESKAIIRNAVGACPEDVVVLGSSLPRFLRALQPQRVALFVSSRETETQLTPWRQCDADIIKIPETKEGYIDLNNLEQKLQENSGTGKRMIGFFPAASKLTGVMADDVATTLLLHQYGALSFWDYTLVAPTSTVDMNPTFPGVEEEMVKKDAMFFNCEKFVGGVQGPHVVVVKKDVFRNSPCFCEDVEVLSERIEEMKTTDAVRAAIVMQLRDAVGLQNIAERQDSITKQVLSHIKNIPELILLGNVSPTVRRLPIFSLMVKHPRGTFLHHNFVCAVLNDVFGIQARGGLNSNLNYGSDVLGIDDKLLKEYEKLLDVEAQKEIARVRKLSDVKAPEVPIHNEHLRPGFCRISLPYFMSDMELAFVLEALKMVATEGWKILPQYVVNPETGQWRHHTCSVLRDRKTLHSLRFSDGKVSMCERRISGPGIFPQTFTECLQTARNLFNRARKLAMKCSTAEPEVSFNPRIDYLRWFMLPKEAHDLLLGRSANVKHIVPFDPSGYTGARKSLHVSRSSITSSPILGSSARHFSLSAIDDCQIFRLKQKTKFYSRESSLRETHKEDAVTNSPPVQFAVGESVSPLRLGPSKQPLLVRSRCYSLGSDNPPVQLSAQTKMNLGLKETSPNNVSEKPSNFCNCGSQTDLFSLDDPMISPGKSLPYSTQSSTSTSDCSQVGRSSPTTSLTSHTSEDIHAYVKEMTREIATEIKSEIREVISKVDDILENSDAVDQSNLSINSISSQNEKNSVSVIDVAEYLMGMSREMASEVKHEIREMVNQVDEMISPDYAGNCARKSSPPQTGRRRIGSGPELGLDLNKNTQCLRKCPTSPVLPIQYDEEDGRYCKLSPQSPKSSQCTPSHEASGPNSISFNSSETSTPDTIIQVVTTQNSPNLPKSLSSNKLSDDEASCNDMNCRHCCIKKTWCQNPSVSSQDSGINMTFTDTDSYLDFDPTTNKGRKIQGRLRICQKHEKNEVPDIIEGVPVCSGDHITRPIKRYDTADPSRIVFQMTEDAERNRPVGAVVDSKRSSRSSNASSSCSERSSRSSGYGTDQRTSQEERFYDRSMSECRTFKPEFWEEEPDDSSACSDNSLTDFTFDDEGKWQCPPKPIWKSTVEAIQEYNMIRPGDKVLVCLSGGRESIALLHTMHQYQFYARSKGIHFSIGALYVHEPSAQVDPLHLMAYCKTLGVKFIYQDKLEDDDCSSAGGRCRVSRWSVRGVRRALYRACSAHGYASAALAQSLEHAAATFLASALHAGALAALHAHATVREHGVRIIRPLIYVRWRALQQWASERALPDFRNYQPTLTDGRSRSEEKILDRSISEPCGSSEKPAGVSSSRSLEEPLTDTLTDPMESARELLANQENMYPYIYSSLKNALHPLITGRNFDQKQREQRHRKKSVIQMKNGAPVFDSDEDTEEEPVP